MAKVNVQDNYDQFLTLITTMSAANTLTFSQVNVGISIFDYAAFLISRIEYTLDVSSVLGELGAATDVFYAAVCGSDGIADLEVNRPEVYDVLTMGCQVTSAASQGVPVAMPIVHDFSNMSGGGILVPAGNIYFGLDSSGFVGAGGAKARVWYRVKPLDAADYLELAQRLRVLSSS